MFVNYVTKSGRSLESDLTRGLNIGIVLRFDDQQPNAFGAPRAVARSFSDGKSVYDTRQGASCNVQIISVIPHCNGTHTESIAHIVDDGPPISEVGPLGLIPATLTSVRPETGAETSDSYHPSVRDSDLLITSRSLAHLAEIRDTDLLKGLVIRTLPNGSDKTTRDYGTHAAPYFSNEAIDFVINLGVEHLLVDMASIDRGDDEGIMSAHHRWFGLEIGDKTCVTPEGSRRTITELIFVDDSIPDGEYLVSLQIAPLLSDASPSRPILFPLIHSKSEEI